MSSMARKQSSGNWIHVVGALVVAAILLWVWLAWNQAGDRAGERACEIQYQTGSCFYDEDLEDWIPQ